MSRPNWRIITSDNFVPTPLQKWPSRDQFWARNDQNDQMRIFHHSDTFCLIDHQAKSGLADENPHLIVLIIPGSKLIAGRPFLLGDMNKIGLGDDFRQLGIGDKTLRGSGTLPSNLRNIAHLSSHPLGQRILWTSDHKNPWGLGIPPRRFGGQGGNRYNRRLGLNFLGALTREKLKY